MEVVACQLKPRSLCRAPQIQLMRLISEAGRQSLWPVTEGDRVCPRRWTELGMEWPSEWMGTSKPRLGLLQWLWRWLASTRSHAIKVW